MGVLQWGNRSRLLDRKIVRGSVAATTCGRRMIWIHVFAFLRRYKPDQVQRVSLRTDRLRDRPPLAVASDDIVWAARSHGFSARRLYERLRRTSLKPPIEGFAQTASAYRKSRMPYPKAMTQWLCDQPPVDLQAWVLDLGCGPGTLTHPLSQRFARVVGLDPTQSMLESFADDALQTPRRISTIRGIGEECPLANGVIGGVAVSQSLHWMQPRRALEEVRRILVPTGWLLICWQEWMPPSSGVERFIADHVANALGAPIRRDPGRPTMSEIAELMIAGECQQFAMPQARQYTHNELLELVLSREFIGRRSTSERAALCESWAPAAQREFPALVDYEFQIQARFYPDFTIRRETCN